MRLFGFLLFLFLFGTALVGAEDAAENTADTVKLQDAFSDEDRKALEDSQETHEFQAEVNRLMDIIINSLYSNREIFLRELISNSADALDKIRFMSLTDESIMGEHKDLDIKIKFNSAAKTITITDTGVGMTKDNLLKNLGVVAKSGTTEFIEAAASGKDSLSLIGQFGVGFYSVYLVAEKVTVISKHNDDDQYIWESTANSVFTVAKDPRGNTLGRGTSIIIKLKEDAEEFLDENTLTKLVTRYSQFINFPISLLTTKEVEEQVPVEKDESEQKESSGEDDLEITEDEDEADKKTKTVRKTVEEWKRLNEAKPLWTRNPKDISEEEYHEFYKQISKDSEPPMDYIHFVAEGEITFRAILYIPSKVDPKIYDQFYEKSTSLKLFVRRVLIADEFDDLLPKYLNFIKGVVDSDDLPLNVSRETLAQSRVLKVMSKKITRKVLEMLRKIANKSKKKNSEDDESSGEADASDEKTAYDKFWAEYSKSIKMGVMDDKKNKSKLTKLLRYQTSKSNGKLSSLEEYVDRMKEDQNKIYLHTGESVAQMKASPPMEKFDKLGLEVVLMDEPIDEYVAQHIHEFDGIEPFSIVRENVPLAETKHFKELKAANKDLVEFFKKTLGKKVQSVAVSNRIVKSPAMLCVSEYGWSANMERIMKGQAMGDYKKQTYNAPKKVFEFNPFHPIIVEMERRRQNDPEDKTLIELTSLLYDSALVTSGFSMEDSEGFSKAIRRFVSLGLDVDPDAEVTAPVEEKGGDEAEDAAEAGEEAKEEAKEEATEKSEL
mmetsp:Transcript_29393/g.57673  ORF Transcript_29393/g.57673 Transcript_29393/m.57673 type:complete len:776 (+) Transcript_29393:58-2385(+)